MDHPHTIEELGDEITSLAGHLNASTCRWLELIGEFDERGGWADWGCKSCAHWLSWRCALTPGTAREQVRVAHRLRDLPLIRNAFAAGELSYSKVRAISRIEHVEREAELLALAQQSTASQLERIVRGYRRVTTDDAARAFERRRLSIAFEDDGSLRIHGTLPPDDGAVLLKALELARDDLRQAEWDRDRTAEPEVTDADALVTVLETALAARTRTPDAPGRTGGDRSQIIVHVDVETLAERDETTADSRCELEDAQPIAAETARRLCCDASIVTVLERDGELLSVGRKTRSVPPALRRALETRDGGCRFPGCTQRRHVDAHHIEHWARGGVTSAHNLVLLCRFHHTLLHEGGYTVQRCPDGTLAFRAPDGRPLHTGPAKTLGTPRQLRSENAARGVTITPSTTVPDWNGDVLHLGDAVEAMLHVTGELDAQRTPGMPNPPESPSPPQPPGSQPPSPQRRGSQPPSPPQPPA